MNLFKPKHTVVTIVRELVAGLEDESIVLSNEAGALPSENETDSKDLGPEKDPKNVENYLDRKSS